MKLVCDVLDEQLVDRHGVRMGKADGIVAELREGAPPRLVAIETGAAVLARLLSPRCERIALAINRRLGVAPPRYRIPWSLIRDFDVDITLDLDATETPAFAWERWIREHIIRRLPFS